MLLRPFTLILSDAGPVHVSGLNVTVVIAETSLLFNSQPVVVEAKVPDVVPVIDEDNIVSETALIVIVFVPSVIVSKSTYF